MTVVAYVRITSAHFTFPSHFDITTAPAARWQPEMIRRDRAACQYAEHRSRPRALLQLIRLSLHIIPLLQI